MDGWKMIFLLGRPIFRGHVSFREGNPSKFSWNLNITQFEKETHLNQTTWKRSHIRYTIWLFWVDFPFSDFGVCFLVPLKVPAKCTWRIIPGRMVQWWSDHPHLFQPFISAIWKGSHNTTRSWKGTYYCWWFRNPKPPPGMVLKPCKSWDIYHINWWVYRISEPSTRITMGTINHWTIHYLEDHPTQ